MLEPSTSKPDSVYKAKEGLEVVKRWSRMRQTEIWFEPLLGASQRVPEVETGYIDLCLLTWVC